MRINLPVSQAVTVTISDAVGKIVSADPAIADAQPITDKSIYLVGKAFGTTTVNLFSAAGAPVGLLAVEVGADTADMRALDPRRRAQFQRQGLRPSTAASCSRALSPTPPRCRRCSTSSRQYGSPADHQHHDPRRRPAGQSRSPHPRGAARRRPRARHLMGRQRRRHQSARSAAARAIPPPTRRRSRPSSPTSSRAAASTSPPPSTRSRPRASSAPSPIPT